MELKVFTNRKGKALYYMRSVRKKGKKNPTKEKVKFLGSKFSTWKKRSKLFLGNSEFSDDDVYRSLKFFAQYREDLLVHLHQKVKKLYKRDTPLVVYDVTDSFPGEDVIIMLKGENAVAKRVSELPQSMKFKNC